MAASRAHSGGSARGENGRRWRRRGVCETRARGGAEGVFAVGRGGGCVGGAAGVVGGCGPSQQGASVQVGDVMGGYVNLRHQVPRFGCGVSPLGLSDHALR